MATIAVQKRAELEGRLVRPAGCDICAVEGTDLGWHLEDYGRPVEDARALCPECHLRLHSRFAKPNLWRTYCLELRAGRKGAFRTVGHYMGATRAQWTAPDAPQAALSPIPGRWWEFLTFQAVNLTHGQNLPYLAMVSHDMKRHDAQGHQASLEL